MCGRICFFHTCLNVGGRATRKLKFYATRRSRVSQIDRDVVLSATVAIKFEVQRSRLHTTTVACCLELCRRVMWLALFLPMFFYTAVGSTRAGRRF